jgi:L-asparaginase II
LPVKALQCGCHVPLYAELGVAPAPGSWGERHHNCSGKHAGLLARCVQDGLPVGTYLAPPDGAAGPQAGNRRLLRVQ